MMFQLTVDKNRLNDDVRTLTKNHRDRLSEVEQLHRKEVSVIDTSLKTTARLYEKSQEAVTWWQFMYIGSVSVLLIIICYFAR
jgi:hypothetical protein